MKTLKIVEYALKHGVCPNWIQQLVQKGRIPGAYQEGPRKVWRIPEDAEWERRPAGRKR